jgi:hypothetical protein
MGSYYLDIETTGTEPSTSKIVTIQYVELERGTGKQIGDIQILKEWELGEEEMLRQFIINSPVVNTYNFDFIPVGFNLSFEHKFLNFKSLQYKKLYPINIISRPNIDLQNITVLMNKGEFKDSGLDKFTNKPHSGHPVPEWYKTKQYEKIEEYIKEETVEFIKLYTWLHEELPILRSKLDMMLQDNDSKSY